MSTPEIRAIGERIRSARKEAGLTQHRLAKMCGFSSAPMINYLESGRRDSRRHVHKIAKALKKPISWFYGDTDQEMEEALVKAKQFDELSTIIKSAVSAYTKKRKVNLTSLLTKNGLNEGQIKKVKLVVKKLKKGEDPTKPAPKATLSSVLVQQGLSDAQIDDIKKYVTKVKRAK